MECKLIGISNSAADELGTKETDWSKRDATLKKLMGAYQGQPQFSVTLPNILCEKLAHSLAVQVGFHFSLPIFDSKSFELY